MVLTWSAAGSVLTLRTPQGIERLLALPETALAKVSRLYGAWKIPTAQLEELLPRLRGLREVTLRDNVLTPFGVNTLAELPKRCRIGAASGAERRRVDGGHNAEPALHHCSFASAGYVPWLYTEKLPFMWFMSFITILLSGMRRHRTVCPH